MPRAKKAAEPTTEAAPAVITAYKGFNQNFACTPEGKLFQYEIGKSYKHEGEVIRCGNGGFHACEHPLNVFSYYPPATSRYAVVELSGQIAREKGGDTKIAAAQITIKAEIRLPELIAAAIKYVTDRVKWIDGAIATNASEGVKSAKDGGAATASGTRGAATASGTCGAATASGDRGAATASGTRGAATASGWWGAATASGPWGAATASGHWGAATASGYQGAATASGWWGAATASGTRGAATASGYQGAATASGDRGAATASGDRGAATASGEQGIAMASGPNGKARGTNGCDLVLREFDGNGRVIARWIGTVGVDGIKPDQFYRLVDGKPIEVA